MPGCKQLQEKIDGGSGGDRDRGHDEPAMSALGEPASCVIRAYAHQVNKSATPVNLSPASRFDDDCSCAAVRPGLILSIGPAHNEWIMQSAARNQFPNARVAAPIIYSLDTGEKPVNE